MPGTWHHVLVRSPPSEREKHWVTRSGYASCPPSTNTGTGADIRADFAPFSALSPHTPDDSWPPPLSAVTHPTATSPTVLWKSGCKVQPRRDSRYTGRREFDSCFTKGKSTVKWLDKTGSSEGLKGSELTPPRPRPSCLAIYISKEERPERGGRARRET